MHERQEEDTMNTNTRTDRHPAKPAPKEGVVARTTSLIRLDIAEIASAIARSYAGRPALSRPAGRTHRV